MPGNVKLGSSTDPDPDPTPFLFVSMETKRTDMLKPYDPKKSVWVPDAEGGFTEALLQVDDGKKATVLIGHEVSLRFYRHGPNQSYHVFLNIRYFFISLK